MLKNKKKSIKEPRKEKVAVYTVYHFDEIEYGIETENKIREYCQKNNYEIVKYYRGSFFHNTEIGYDNKLQKLFLDRFKMDCNKDKERFDKVIIYRLSDVNFDLYKQFAFWQILDELGVDLITLKEGKIGEDFVFMINSRTNSKNNVELKDLFNPYLLEEDKCENMENDEEELPF